MSDLPFTISADATACLAQMLEKGDNGTLEPELSYSLGYVAYGINEKYDGPHVVIGWNTREVHLAYGYVKMQLAGREICIHPFAVKELAGKTIRLETVNVGNPDPKANSTELLVVR